MEIVIASTPRDAAVIAARAIERVVTAKAHPVLGLATGSSPLGIYAELIERHHDGLSFAHTTAFLLDEYVGLEPTHPEAYRAFIEREFTSQIDLTTEALHGPDGNGENLGGAGQVYESQIAAAGGVDLQILGIGSDGHIGFNEPGSSLGSRTRVKTLTEDTRNDNARFFQGNVDDVPRHVLTQGIGTILDADHLVMIATGGAKALPIARAVEGPITAMVPASALQLHPHTTVIIDEAAASQLSLADYYREAYDNKPDWQQI